MLSLTFLKKRSGPQRRGQLFAFAPRPSWARGGAESSQTLHQSSDVLVERVGIPTIWQTIAIGVGTRGIGAKSFKLELIIQPVLISVCSKILDVGGILT